MINVLVLLINPDLHSIRPRYGTVRIRKLKCSKEAQFWKPEDLLLGIQTSLAGPVHTILMKFENLLQLMILQLIFIFLTTKIRITSHKNASLKIRIQQRTWACVHENQIEIRTNAVLIVDSECGQKLEYMPPFLTHLYVVPVPVHTGTVYYRNFRNTSILLNKK